MKTGIIGYGRFGKLAADYLSRFTDVSIYDKYVEFEGAAGLEEICGCDAVILCVPISGLEETLQAVKHLLRPGVLVADVCSVKMYPVRLMREILPNHAEILGTHPLFGPDSFTGGARGRKIVFCKTRIREEKYRQVTGFFARKGFEILHKTPEEHDRAAAVSLNIPHLIGRALKEFGASSHEIDTAGYRALLEVMETSHHDTWQLFKDMNLFNPFAGEAIESFRKAIESVCTSLNQATGMEP
ncbi:MAG: prephenate dehydrogenase/arogenate dehydrogenase family protein [Planctomycetota bacterium]